MPRTRFASLMVLVLMWMLFGSLHLLSGVSRLLTLILVFVGTAVMSRTSMMMMLLMESTRTTLTMMNPGSWTATTPLHLPLAWSDQSYVPVPNTDLVLEVFVMGSRKVLKNIYLANSLIEVLQMITKEALCFYLLTWCKRLLWAQSFSHFLCPISLLGSSSGDFNNWEILSQFIIP